ncbi:MAG: hypothetical protein JWN66_2750 [Sphingomonas bacterium]|uniref:DUF2844 domain-containing protein n=1 Tax=Sphingomonas bacterium TaxID=1895847 RepID=UPI00260AC668|nr:DUF2844 domain-containing protein [Sphingomonas bacterium]MDB5705634.1 hypothetical protein [Sphingomonas bacterium]
MIVSPGRSPLLPFAAVLLTASLYPAGARAELGGTMSGVQADGARMARRVASVTLDSYTRHDLTRANGGMVREFTNAKGQVFAITWSGPGKPDLRTLLGRYFATLQADSGGIGRTMHSLRRPPQVSQPDLQIQTGGHMGWFNGVALIPSLAPRGFAATGLVQEP